MKGWLILGLTKRCEGLASDAANAPVLHELCTDALVESDRGFVPVQDAPFKTATALTQGGLS